MFSCNIKRHGTPLTPAFTLVELLVSMSVILILTLVISQIVSNVTSVTLGNREHMDADAQARLVFDRLSLDFARMPKRPDIDYLFAKLDGSAGGENDAMFFYSEAPAYYDGDSTKLGLRNTVSLIGYRINAAYQLERLGKRLTWDGVPGPASGSNGVSNLPGGVIFLSPGAGAAPDPNSTLAVNWASVIGNPSDNPPYSQGNDYGDYEVLANQVCRLEFCFQLVNGYFSPIPVAPTVTTSGGAPAYNLLNKLDGHGAPVATNDASQGYEAGSRWYDTTNRRGYVCVGNTLGAAVWKNLGMQDVRAVVVALAILDQTSAKIVPTTTATVGGQSVQGSDFSKLVPCLSDAAVTDAASGGSGDTTVPNLALPTSTMPTARLMAEAWGNRINQPDFAMKSGLPLAAAGQVRVYQRIFALNMP